MFDLMKANSGGLTKRSGGLASMLGSNKNEIARPPMDVGRPDAVFLEKHANKNKVGFIIDATGSRTEAWETAKVVQGDMLKTVGDKLALRLVSFGGNAALNDTYWETDSQVIIGKMNDVSCKAGGTQILSSLDKFIDDPEGPKVVVLIGDAYEEGEMALMDKAELLKGKGIKVFAFHEGANASSAEMFEKLAFATGGAFAKLEADMPLGDLCNAVKTYAVKGDDGLKQLAQGGDAAAKRLASGMKLLGPG